MNVMKKNKILIISIILSLLWLALISAYAWRFFFHNPFSDSKFTVLNWKEAKPDIRAEMADDLIMNYLKPGMSRKQIIGMLGETGSQNKDNKLQYWIGSWSFSSKGYDDTFIFIKFDKSDKLISAEINGY